MSTTGVAEETLTHIGTRMASAPHNAENFEIHRGLQVGSGCIQAEFFASHLSIIVITFATVCKKLYSTACAVLQDCAIY